MNTHRQCLLQRDGALQTSWIPSTHAQRGRTIDLKEDGGWSRGWLVVEAWDPPMPSKVIVERERDFARHRQATDI